MTAVAVLARRLGMGTHQGGGRRAEQAEADIQVLAHMLWSSYSKLERLLEAILQRPTL